MKQETKTILYMILDILDSIERTAETSNLFSVNKHLLDDARKEIVALITKEKNTTVDKKVELIGLLPSALIDRKKFPRNEDLVKLAKNSLGIEINNWEKRSREDIIGRIIIAIENMPPEKIELFVQAWKDFIYNENKKLETKSISHESNKNKKTFVDIWLEYFENYNKKVNFKGGKTK